MSDTGIPSAFGDVVLLLLRGEFICRHTTDAVFHFLSDEANYEAVNQYLSRLGIGLRRTVDGEAIYSAYLDADSADRRTAIKQQFRETINHLAPLAEWLELIMAGQRSSAVLHPGDIVRESVLLAAIEGAPALSAALTKLSAGALFKVKNPAPKVQISKVLEALCVLGYLKAQQANGSTYVATGRWSYFYEVMEFIAEHERIDVAPQQPDLQQDMLS